MKLLIAGDIISFSNLEQGIIHTVVVVNVPWYAGFLGARQTKKDTLNEIMVASKKGTNLECVKYLSSVRFTYSCAQIIRFWRARRHTFWQTWV
jgi:hypothetical protein